MVLWVSKGQNWFFLNSYISLLTWSLNLLILFFKHLQNRTSHLHHYALNLNQVLIIIFMNFSKSLPDGFTFRIFPLFIQSAAPRVLFLNYKYNHVTLMFKLCQKLLILNKILVQLSWVIQTVPMLPPLSPVVRYR